MRHKRRTKRTIKPYKRTLYLFLYRVWFFYLKFLIYFSNVYLHKQMKKWRIELVLLTVQTDLLYLIYISIEILPQRENFIWDWTPVHHWIECVHVLPTNWRRSFAVTIRNCFYWLYTLYRFLTLVLTRQKVCTNGNSFCWQKTSWATEKLI